MMVGITHIFKRNKINIILFAEMKKRTHTQMTDTMNNAHGRDDTYRYSYKHRANT